MYVYEDDGFNIIVEGFTNTEKGILINTKPENAYGSGSIKDAFRTFRKIHLDISIMEGH